MLLMWILTLFILAGCVAIWRWGGNEMRQPWLADDDAETTTPIREAIRRYLWYVCVGTAAGLTSGFIMAGVGGRLAMRILAATASDSAQGRITEADQIVGEITLNGSLGFIFFIGVTFGLPSAAVYLLTRRWLPKGWLGGLALGALLLLLFSTSIDPLRPDNIDFDLVGPGWLAVLIFVAMGLGQGMLLAAVAGRYSKSLPLISKNKQVLVRYIPAALLLPVVPAAGIALLIGAVYVIGTRIRPIARLGEAKNVALIGRAVVILTMIVALPNCLSAVIDIAGRP